MTTTDEESELSHSCESWRSLGVDLPLRKSLAQEERPRREAGEPWLQGEVRKKHPQRRQRRGRSERRALEP